MTQVKDIGELGLLNKLQRFCPREIIGDDGAVIVTDSKQSLVVTTDVLVDGVHFSNVTTSPEDAGWRAAAANLSDLAAMGASPLGITVGLALPGDRAVSWVERLYEGMTSCLEKYHTPIVGGDIVRSPITTISITAFGQAYPDQIIRRNTAQVGDTIVVTGAHGASHAGLQLLLHPHLRQGLDDLQQNALINAHQRPKPRLDLLPILRQVMPSLPISGMDSSDGLADAIVQICRASGVGAVIETSKISVPTSFHYWLTPEKALEYALYGGEDFELVLCLPQTAANTLVPQLQTLNSDTAVIGTITEGEQVLIQNQAQKNPVLERGFQHFG